MTEQKIWNEDLLAGSPMYYDCIACGAQKIVVPETWVTKPDLCTECQALQKMGWLDEATAQPMPEPPKTKKKGD